VKNGMDGCFAFDHLELPAGRQPRKRGNKGEQTWHIRKPKRRRYPRLSWRGRKTAAAERGKQYIRKNGKLGGGAGNHRVLKHGFCAGGPGSLQPRFLGKGTTRIRVSKKKKYENKKIHAVSPRAAGIRAHFSAPVLHRGVLEFRTGKKIGAAWQGVKRRRRARTGRRGRAEGRSAELFGRGAHDRGDANCGSRSAAATRNVVIPYQKGIDRQEPHMYDGPCRIPSEGEPLIDSCRIKVLSRPADVGDRRALDFLMTAPPRHHQRNNCFSGKEKKERKKKKRKIAICAVAPSMVLIF